jgi:outer membrane protein assembly factor BamB
MKFSKLSPIFLILLLGVLLSACTGGSGAVGYSGFPGLTVDDGNQVVYLGSGTEAYAINSASGQEKWRFPSQANQNLTFYVPPTPLTAAELLLPSYGKQMFKLNSENGSEIQSPNWPFNLCDNYLIAAPLVTDAAIFVPCANNILYALNLDGSKKWEFSAGDALWATPVIAGDLLVLPSMDHFLYALDPQSGNLIWKSESLGGSVPGTPAVSADQSTLYVGSYSSKLFAVDALTGNFIWQTDTDGWVHAGPVLVDDTLYFGDLNGVFYAVNVDGSVKWQVSPDTSQNKSIGGTALVHNGVIYFGSRSGSLFALDAATGANRWNKEVGGRLYAGPALLGETLLVAPNDAEFKLAALDLNGNQKWTFTPEKK